MPLFEHTSPNVIGVDIGSASIKMIELANRNGLHHLVNYGFIDRLERNVRTSVKEDAAFVAAQLKAIREKTKFTTTHAVAALPTYAVFSSIISLPQMKKEELASAVRWEAKKIIPLPLEDIVLDYRVLNKPAVKAKGFFAKKEAAPAQEELLKILITGAPRDLVKRYTEIFSQADLQLTSLETESFALTRALVGAETAETMIVEFGATTTDIIIAEAGVPFLSRSIEVGGQVLTRAIMNSLNINEKRAEQLKRDIGIMSFDAASGSGGVPEIIEKALEPILHEIRYTFDIYKNNTITPSGKSTGMVEKIVLTGGSAMMPNIASYFAKQLDTNVIVGDPWARVVYPEDLRPVLAGVGSKFSVSIGLAMRTDMTA